MLFVLQIHPTTGPSQGGTKLTILGKNLGKDFEDIDGGIEVANVACNPIREEFKASTKYVFGDIIAWNVKMKKNISVFPNNLINNYFMKCEYNVIVWNVKMKKKYKCDS